VDVIPDPEVVFITYADIPIETLRWIKEEISKIAYFEKVIFKQASAAISSNCGPGAFGILYFIKSNKSYNLSSFFESDSLLFEDDIKDEDESTESEISFDNEDEIEETSEVQGSLDVEKEQSKWFESLEGIDSEVAIKNSGSEDAFKNVLKIFYDSIDSKAEELEKYYAEEDYKNYTIKVHALKSSCKLIGAVATSDKAQFLENAGKEENIDYIKENHPSFIKEYLGYKEILGKVFQSEETEDESDIDKPVADEFLMESVYEGIHDAAEAMDCDAIEEVLKEIEGYAIPENEIKKFKEVTAKADEFDYDGILKILDEG
jgi:HPt (histidine-containing phosphotransfer) domain-containing protein